MAIAKPKERVRFIKLSDEDYLFGDLICYENRQAMVCRTETDRWTVFVYEDCRMWSNGWNRSDTDKRQALREALHYVLTGIVLQKCEREPVRLKSDDLVRKYVETRDPYKTISAAAAGRFECND